MRRWEVIADLINKHGYKTIAEIGIARGDTARYVLENCDITYYLMVDPQPRESYIEKILEDYPQSRWKKETSEVASMHCDNNFDLIFIDALHDYDHIKQDIELWLPKIKQGGVICGHDYNNTRFPGIARAVNEIFAYQLITLIPVRRCQMWIKYV